MAHIKPELEKREVVALASELLGAQVTHLDAPETGQIARTFFFKAHDQDYVVRFNRDTMGAANFPMEAYIYANYASPRIPIPEILHLGRHGDLHYAISRRVLGDPLLTLPYPEYRGMISVLLDTLDAIHGVEVVGRQGYGTFTDDGVGLFPSWRESLAVIREEEESWDFCGKWHHLFEDSFLERDLFDRVYNRMFGLLEHCPEERHLVHGGYDLSNVLRHKGRITGVLDWLDAKYGDFVYDVTWLEFWTPGEGYVALCRSRYAARVGVAPGFDQRVLCYHCYQGLSGMLFCAKADDQDGYGWVRERILGLLGLSSGIDTQ